jgi:hypothetical protein
MTERCAPDLVALSVLSYPFYRVTPDLTAIFAVPAFLESMAAKVDGSFWRANT